MIGQLARILGNGVSLREHPDGRSKRLADLQLYTPVRILGGSGAWYRVSLPDGTLGFIAARLTEPADQPIRSELIADGGVLRSQPQLGADRVENLTAGSQVPVLGSYAGFLYVQSPSGRAGWLTFN